MATLNAMTIIPGEYKIIRSLDKKEIPGLLWMTANLTTARRLRDAFSFGHRSCSNGYTVISVDPTEIFLDKMISYLAATPNSQKEIHVRLSRGSHE